jgi:hypothetical protein
MIDIKRCNYFTGELSQVGYAISDIVNILELEERNCLLVTKPKPIDSSTKNEITSLIHHMNPQYIFKNWDDFSKLLEDKNNFFRTDLIVFDFWSINKALIPKYKELIDKLDIDYIIVAKEYTYKTTDDVNDYHVSSESDYSSTIYRNDRIIKDHINGWSATIKSLKEAYIRDKKLDDILGDILDD